MLFARPEAAACGLPDVTSLDWRAAADRLGLALLLFRFKWGVMEVLAVAALAGLVLADSSP